MDELFKKLDTTIRISHLVNIFYRKSPQNFCFPGERHNFWEMIYVDKGCLLITADKQKHLIKSGEIIFHAPGEFHAIDSWDRIAANFIGVAFVCKSSCMKSFRHKILTPNLYERNILYEALRYSQKIFLPIPLNVMPEERYMTELESDMVGLKQLIRCQLEQFLILLCNQQNDGTLDSHVESASEQKRKCKLVDDINEFLEKHLTDTVALEDISKDLGYSVAQMKKVYKAETGNSIIDTFISMKIDEAQRLIWEGKMNITQIANHLGYGNMSYFSRVFTKKVGMSPREFSKSIGGLCTKQD